jgi:hypothetical protein
MLSDLKLVGVSSDPSTDIGVDMAGVVKEPAGNDAGPPPWKKEFIIGGFKVFVKQQVNHLPRRRSRTLQFPSKHKPLTYLAEEVELFPCTNKWITYPAHPPPPRSRLANALG